MMTRQEAYDYLCSKITNENLRRHCLASEAIMRKLAAKFGEDQDLWGLAGLIHDVDLEAIAADPKRHAQTAADWLAGQVPDTVVGAIRAHNAEELGFSRQSRFEHALAAAETLTGMIVAMALILPEKKLAGVKTKSILKRMKEKQFAAGVNRETILECEKIGLPLDEFVTIGIAAMQEIHESLGM